MRKFWDLPSEERQKLVFQRMHGDKWIVWDYCPDKQGNYGIIEKCPPSIDRGFQHGYVFKSPKVCALHHSYAGIDSFEINVYSDNFPLDETFEGRSKNMWHMFTSREKAEQYASNIKKIYPEILSLQDLLAKVKEVFPNARISTGKRGYEAIPYKCIVADHGWTTFDLSDGLIGVRFGQQEKYVIPHSELIKPAFSDIEEGYINDKYCIDYSFWNEFYGDSLRKVKDNRNEIVIPAAKQALIERAKDPSPHASLTDNQVKALDRYCTLFSDKTPKEDILSSLIDNMENDFREARVPDAWVKDLRDEVIGLARGERRDVVEGLKR